MKDTVFINGQGFTKKEIRDCMKIAIRNGRDLEIGEGVKITPKGEIQIFKRAPPDQTPIVREIYDKWKDGLGITLQSRF